MATVSVNVICGNKTLNVHNLSLQQRIDWHHSFRIAVASESLEGKKAINVDKSIKLLGEQVDITIQSKKNLSGDGLNFKGIVTSVHIDSTYTEDNMIILSGYSPSYLLEDGLGCQSFEKKKGEKIFKDIVSAYPFDENPFASGNYKKPIPYMVRYKETNFQFLSRLAAMYGEWMYYDGQRMVYGKIQETNKVKLVLGTDLQSYEYGVTMKPTNFDWLSYDYSKNNQISQTTTSYKPASIKGYAETAMKVAKDKFAGGHKIPTIYDIKEERQLMERIEISKTSMLSDSTTLSGQSINPSLTIGTKLSVEKKGSDITEPMRVIGVHHHVNQNKDYSNNFEALPFGCLVPPVNSNVFKTEAEAQVAVVKENHDPDGLGRIRVQFNWQSGNEMTPWIRVVTSSAAGGRGMYFVPEKDDEVLVDFEQGNPNRPYAAGALFHGAAKPTWGQSENNLKAIKTRGGHTILLSDEEGKESISISDKNGNSITLDTAKKQITINAPEKLVLSSKQISIEASEKVTIHGTQNVEVKSMDVKIDGTQKVAVTSTTEVDVSSQMQTKVSGLMTEVTGTTQLDLSSDLMLNAKAMITNVEGQTITNVKGNVALNLNC